MFDGNRGVQHPAPGYTWCIQIQVTRSRYEGKMADVAKLNGNHGFSTLAIHAGEGPDPTTNAHNTPIYQTSTYAFESLEVKQAAADSNGYFYTRNSNPTTSALETKIAALEGAEAALAGASGMAVISATLLTLLHQGDHIVYSSEVYHYSLEFFEHRAEHYGIDATPVDITDLEAVQSAIRPETKAIYCEFLSNPRIQVADIPELVKIARDRRILLIVDNTFTSPYLFRPIEHGVDLSIHSATKYLCGHGDAIAGTVAGSREMIERIHDTLVVLGSCISPFNSWLILRGIRTLELRMERHCANALALAEFIERQPEVSKVNYAGLTGHPGHEIARDLMGGRFGGMLSFSVPDTDYSNQLANALQLADHGVSLGDVFTLVWPNREDPLVRVSVGCENPEDLIADFEQAFETVSSMSDRRLPATLRK
ncbi:aminotransferase class I/II-fold pyridoxal phosphate-dependent enzyme [soil metagenome]